MSRFQPPYLGAAYYPEAWPPEQVAEDIRLMLDAGLNAARIAEFAWSSLEPEEGRFALAWLQRVVEKLGDAGIATILCTPSCTPPAWLTQKCPEVLVVGHDGRPADHGSRRHVCPNSPVYRQHCALIARQLAAAFGQDENVIGWQIDNEVYLWEDWGCYCERCIRSFREKMREKLGTIEALNDAWGTHLWSQTYQDFAQLPAPRPGICHHPSLLTAWILFQNESIVEYVAHQAAVLHECVTQPVGTDMMPMLGVSYEQIHRSLDIVQYNHYDRMDTLWRQVFWMDYARPFKKVPFWNTETATCWNGGVTANGFKAPGFCRANSWLPIALGGEANLYWLWRAHWSGQELMHGSVISSCGRPLHILDEVREVGAGFRAAAKFLNGTRPSPPGLALHVSTLAWAQMRFQPMANGFDYTEYMLSRAYRPLMDAHLRADLIDPAASLDEYRLLFSPFLPALDESGLRERLRRWIEAGGTWVAGPLTDVRTLEGAKPRHAPFECLEEWTGVYCKYKLPGDPRDFALQWADGTMSHGSLWYAGFETAGTTPLAMYTEEPLAGLAAATETRLGRGRIILLGTLPRPEDLQRLMLRLAGECGLAPSVTASSNVLAVPRAGAAGRGMVVIEIENRTGTLTLPRPARDEISGREYSGEVTVQPYQVMVLRG
jgi:beta-galactosidase GanA